MDGKEVEVVSQQEVSLLSVYFRIGTVDAKIERVLGRLEEQGKYCSDCKADTANKISAVKSDLDVRLDRAIHDRQKCTDDFEGRVRALEDSRDRNSGRSEAKREIKVEGFARVSNWVAVVSILVAIAAIIYGRS